MTPTKAYKVLSKEERSHLNRKAGEMETYYIIKAVSAGGTEFTVNVLVDELNEAEGILTARATALDSI